MDINRKIGIFGGTFDPIHIGHLIIAEDVRQKFNLDSIVFLPSGTPPHKKSLRVTEAEHRYQMVSRAIKSNPYFQVSRMEIERKGYTYTIDTLTHLEEILGLETQLFYFVGADTVLDLTNWKNYELVLKKYQFISVLRPGFGLEAYERQIEMYSRMYGARIHPMNALLIEISSTMIRENIAQGRSIKYLVPHVVEEYILEHGLYRESNTEKRQVRSNDD